MIKYKVGILTTHPIQYQIPWFRALHIHPEIDLTVFFCMIPDSLQQGDGFGVAFQWDIPLLDGYDYQVLENRTGNPSVTTFRGCNTPNIERIVKDGVFDAFLVNGWVVRSCLQLLWACRKYGVPCIVRGESNTLRLRAWWKRMIHRVLLKQYAAFLNIGKSNQDFYLANGVAREKIFFAPYCIDNLRFKQSTEALQVQRNAIRSEWQVDPAACTFLFCGKFIEKKCPNDLLKALVLAIEKIDDTFRKIHLLMVGDGELRPLCESFVRTNHLPVTFTGFLNQTEIQKAYAASDCLVLPSDNGETWGLVVNEAMACGVPAIVSDQVGCHPDLIRDDETGYVYPFGNIQALSDCMIRFTENFENKNDLGVRAQELVFSNYSYDQVLGGTLRAIYYVTGKNR